MQQLTGTWALQQHLDTVWRTFFLASPALQPFLGTVHATLAACAKNNAQLGVLELQRDLDSCLADAEQGSMLPSSYLTGELHDVLHVG